MDDDDEDEIFRQKAMALYKTGGGKSEVTEAAKSLTGGKRSKNPDQPQEKSKDDVRTMFDSIDEDGSGLLDREETKQLMTMLFPEQTDAEFDAAFIKMDDDGSGEVDFDEFAAWWKVELKEKGAELERKMREVQEKMKMKKMALQLYHAQPGDDVSKLQSNLANRASKEKSRAAETRKGKVKFSFQDTDSDDGGTSSSDEDVDAKTRARRRKDREIQREKAKKLHKKSAKERVDGAKDMASGLRSRAKSLKAKIKNEDENDRIDGKDEQDMFMEKRRRLMRNLQPGDDSAAETNETAGPADAQDATEWELSFIKRARRRRTIISVSLGMLVMSLIFIPPLVVHMMDNACSDPTEVVTTPFTFDVVLLEHIHVETFRGVVRIESDTNLTHTDRVSVDITKKSVSKDGMAGISQEAELNGAELTVRARYDELLGGTFGLSSCPQADITIRVPMLSRSTPSTGPSLNVTVDGPIGLPVFSPWVPNLVAVIGTIDLVPDPDFVFGTSILRNTVGDISVQKFKGPHLSAVASDGGVTVKDSTLSTCRIVTRGGDVSVTSTELTSPEVVTESYPPGMDRLQQVALGYGVRGNLHVSSSAGNIHIDQVSGGDIAARAGLGDVDLLLPVPGFSGAYDLRAPFGWKSLVVERLKDRTSSGDFCPVPREQDTSCTPWFTVAEAVELDDLFVNSTLAVTDRQLVVDDDSVLTEHRLGRVAGAHGIFGGQRLLAESGGRGASVRCVLREKVANESIITHWLEQNR